MGVCLLWLQPGISSCSHDLVSSACLISCPHDEQPESSHVTGSYLLSMSSMTNLLQSKILGRDRALSWTGRGAHRARLVHHPHLPGQMPAEPLLVLMMRSLRSSLHLHPTMLMTAERDHHERLYFLVCALMLRADPSGHVHIRHWFLSYASRRMNLYGTSPYTECCLASLAGQCMAKCSRRK